VATPSPPIPALLRAARGVYAHTIFSGLAAGGFADLPPNGPWVLGAIARQESRLVELADDLEVSKQAISQLVDLLVQRGYVARGVSEHDRRRRELTLTARGEGALATIRAAIDAVDAGLKDLVSERDLVGLRRGLAALGTIRQAQRHS
jgi:DNA-binding MarR family transcriptional regulator